MTVTEADDPAVQTLLDTINGLDGGAVFDVTDNYTKTIIDFATFDSEGVSLQQRAEMGNVGSSLLLNTRSGDVIGGTLRYGSLDLPAEADLFVAKAFIEEVMMDADPPTETTTTSMGEAGLYVRFRHMESMQGDLLRQEGADIVHIEVNEPMDAEAFAGWLSRFHAAYRDERGSIADRVASISGEVS